MNVAKLRSAGLKLRLHMLMMVKAVVALLAMAAITVQPVAAQSILRDAETEALFRDMVAPLVQVSELDAKDVEVVLINDSQIKRFCCRRTANIFLFWHNRRCRKRGRNPRHYGRMNWAI